MKYREFAPLAALADVIDCLWTLEGRASSDSAAEPVLPDGRPELIVHLGQPFDRLRADGTADLQPPVIFAGQLSEQLLLRPRGHVAVLGVRFHPHGASAILPAPQHELAGGPQALDALHRPLASALEDVRPLYELDVLDVLDEAIATVQAILIRAIDPARIDRRVAFAVRAIARTSGRLSVDALAHAAGVTRRHLERRFLATVGVTPKRLARLTRFQLALRLLQHPVSRRGGTETAAACGYADQAHFIRDFRLLAGCSPGEHLMRQGELTRFFSGNGSTTND